MSTSSSRMLVACMAAFLVSCTLVACGVFTVLSAPSRRAPNPSQVRQAERAAMDVVRPYYRALDAIGADGGKRSERIAKYVTPDHRSQLSVAFASMHAEGLSTTGTTVIVDDRLIGRRIQPRGDAQTGVRVCVDLSRVRVFGPQGEERTPIRRAARIPYDVWLTTRGSPAPHLRIESTTMREELAPC